MKCHTHTVNIPSFCNEGQGFLVLTPYFDLMIIPVIFASVCVELVAFFFYLVL